MSKLESHRTLIAGISSPFMAAALGVAVYMTLTSMSQDRDSDYVFRLMATAAAIATPFFFTLWLALSDRRKARLTGSGVAGLIVASLSLGMTWVPINGALERSRQARNLALKDVTAPEVTTTDIYGKTHRFSDHEGKVILLNIWATWCPPCRAEMPQLDALYKDRADQGLVVFGLSMEELDVQQAFARKLTVSYPLLTAHGDVPEMFTQTARYPANFLIDRQGRLQPAPSTDKPFEELEKLVDQMLQEPGY